MLYIQVPKNLRTHLAQLSTFQCKIAQFEKGLFILHAFLIVLFSQPIT